MIWRDHVFNFGSKLAKRVTKFREKNSRFGNFFLNFEFFESFENYELKFPKSEANFDAERGILAQRDKPRGNIDCDSATLKETRSQQ